jgi:hypothetical protein
MRRGNEPIPTQEKIDEYIQIFAHFIDDVESKLCSGVGISSQLFMDLYDKAFKLSCAIYNWNMELQVLEPSMDKLINMAKGKDLKTRQYIFRIFGYFWRFPARLGRHRDLPHTFLEVTQ